MINALHGRAAAGVVDPEPVAETDVNGQGRQADSPEITFANYRGIFTGDVFSSALINSIGIGLITTVAVVGMGCREASIDFAQTLLVGAALLIAMFPQISLVTPLFNIERRPGLFDTWPGFDHSVHHLRPATRDLHAGAFFPGDSLKIWRRPKWTGRPRPRPSAG